MWRLPHSPEEYAVSGNFLSWQAPAASYPFQRAAHGRIFRLDIAVRAEATRSGRRHPKGVVMSRSAEALTQRRIGIGPACVVLMHGLAVVVPATAARACLGGFAR